MTPQGRIYAVTSALLATAGGYADYLKTSARSVVKLGDSLEPADVAALADAGLTAQHAAAKAARRLHAGERCVIIGAGGLATAASR